MSDSSLHLQFDARTHPDPAERVAAWRDAMSLAVDVLLDPHEIDGFAGRLDFYRLGSVMLVDSRATPHVVVRDQTTIARSGNRHVIFDAFVTGGFSGEVGGRSLTIGPGDGFMMDLGGTMRVRLRKTRYLGVAMPRALYEAQSRGTGADGAASVHGLRLPARGPEANLLRRVLAATVAEAPRLAEPRALGIGLVSMIAAAARAREPCDEDERVALPEADRAPLRRFIERHATDPTLGPGRLCAEFGLSRTALYRLLAPDGGVAEVIRRRRAAIARRRLGDPTTADEPITALARASGFADARALRRALRDFYDADAARLRRAPPEAAVGEHSLAIGAMLDGDA